MKHRTTHRGDALNVTSRKGSIDVTVRVLPKDFRRGNAGDMGSCAIALAMRRHGLLEPRVGLAVLSWMDARTGKRFFVKTPVAIHERISSFHQGTGVCFGSKTPCSFVVKMSEAEKEFDPAI